MPWLRVPRACKRQQKYLTPQETTFLDDEVKRMLKMQAIEPTNSDDLVLSSIYTVPKKNGKRRPVINLRWVNKHMEDVHFKMPSMRDVKMAMNKDCWMASIDLTDCFWGLPLAEKERRNVAFHWKGINYQFKVLPFGLKLSPMFITKLYRNLVEHLQLQGHNVIMYIDDILILGETELATTQSVAAVQKALANLGAHVNVDKSAFVPSQRLTYLGFELDSKQMKIWAPPKKILNTKKSLKQFLRGGKATAREAASLLGKLNSLADALFPARVHTGEMHDFKMAALKKGWDQACPLPTGVMKEVTWWLRHMSTLNGRAIHPPKPTVLAGTDASDYGWGAWVMTSQGKKISWGGHFNKEVAKQHINYKEMLAVKYFLQSCPISLENQVVDVGIDNTTTIWYLTKFGGRKNSLATLAAQIYDEVTHLRCKLMSHHVPGIENVLADTESRRMIHLTDFALKATIFQRADRAFGPHSIDLFANFQDRQIARFCSREPQPETQFIDAFSLSWVRENGWANPPFSMIFRVLHKARIERATLTLLVPFWPAQPWFPMLMGMLVAAPVVLPQVPSLFQHPLLEQGKTPNWLTLVCRISGESCRRKIARRRLSRLSCSLGNLALTRHMTRFGRHGLGSHTVDTKIRQLMTSLHLSLGQQS
jgi:hypothetical protein